MAYRDPEKAKEYQKQYYQKNKEKLKEKRKEYQKQYREENKEKLKEYDKQYRETNKEQIKENKKEYNKKYREANKEKIKEYYEANKEQRKQYRETNKEQIKEYMKKYREANKEKIKIQNKKYLQLPEVIEKNKKSKNKRTKWMTVRNEFLTEQIKKHGKLTCNHCKKEFRWEQVEVDHIKCKALYPELMWDETNFQILCKLCHRLKTNKDMELIRQNANVNAN